MPAKIPYHVREMLAHFQPMLLRNSSGLLERNELETHGSCFCPKLLRRVEDERRSLVLEKRGTPRAVQLSIRDYVKLATPEPEVLRIIGEDSKRNRTNTLTTHQLDQIIKSSRIQRSSADASLRLVIDTNILVSAALKQEGL